MGLTDVEGVVQFRILGLAGPMREEAIQRALYGAVVGIEVHPTHPFGIYLQQGSNVIWKADYLTGQSRAFVELSGVRQAVFGDYQQWLYALTTATRGPPKITTTCRPPAPWPLPAFSPAKHSELTHWPL